jgi:hypothetical protein
LVKIDTELFHKEREIEKMKRVEERRRNKKELD